MKRYLAIIALVVVSLPSGPARAETAVKNDIKEDTTWTKAGSPYVLMRDIDVHPGITLTIEPGVVVQGTRYGGLDVFGTLQATGSVLEPIVFEGYSERLGWDGVEILGAEDQVASESVVTTARFADARFALFVRYATPTISDVTFADNRTAMYVAHPNAPYTIANNVFLENGLALKGYSRRDITVEMNDFWDNGTALVPGPRHHYNCGPDGDWFIHHNDILRGPEDEFWTYDVHSPAGSAPRPYRIDAEDNWWGVSTGDRAAGRFGDWMRSNEDETHQPIDYRPISQAPHTAWTPDGPVADPEPEPSSSLADESWIAFRQPRHGDCIPRGSFEEMKGVSFGGGPAPEGFGEPTTRVMLGRKAGQLCDFWNPSRGNMERRDCGRPVWFEAEGDQWRVDITKRLPAGPYFAETQHGIKGLGAIRFTLN